MNTFRSGGCVAFSLWDIAGVGGAAVATWIISRAIVHFTFCPHVAIWPF